MGYKLADGSDSDLYRSGDTFHYIISVGQFVAGKTVLTAHGQTFIPDENGKITLSLNGIDSYVGEISELTPTEETKRKAAERNQPKCKCGYVIPVMEITGGDLNSVENMLASVFNLGEKKPQDVPEIIPPLARIIDWRGGEEVKPLDFVISNEFGVDYRAVVLEVISPTQIRTCRGVIGVSHGNLTIIRINTAAIPKQRTMTKEEVEREFGVKVVD